MLNGDVRPSTLEGVKRLATQIRKERGIKHSNALDLAAQAANCENFRHARRLLPECGRARAHDVYLTVYWREPETWEIGRQTLKVTLSKPILELATKAELKLARGIGGMRMVAADHFVHDLLAGTRSDARERICKAERSLRFMEYTGLRPSSDYHAAYPDRTQDSKLPNSDHGTDWYDPESGQFVLVDEPYRGAPDEEARSLWARRHGWDLRKSSWAGMYFPYRCDLYVAAKVDGNLDFDELMARIDAIPSPLTQEGWNGESAHSHQVFTSPAATTPQDRRRAKSKGLVMPQASDTTVPFNAMFGQSRRRPRASMPIADHMEVGRMIKAVLGSAHRPYGVYRRMNSLRSRLEDWMALEIGNDQLDGPEFFDVYYHESAEDDPYVAVSDSRDGVLDLLRRLKQKLQSAYPDCQPLRQELNRIDASVKLILNMASSAVP